MTEKRFRLGYVCGDFGLIDNDKWIDLHSMSENSEKNVQICINKMNDLADTPPRLRVYNKNRGKKMTEKRCRDCKHTEGIGFDFWCGEGHTKYESLGETDCPYYEYHDWSKGTPSRTEKRFTLEEFGLNFIVNDNGRNLTAKQTVDKLNQLYEKNEELKQDKTNLHRAMSRNRLTYLNEYKKLKHRNELLEEELKQCRAVIDNRWSEYLQKKELEMND